MQRRSKKPTIKNLSAKMISNILTAPKLHFEQGHCLQGPMSRSPSFAFRRILSAIACTRMALTGSGQGGNRALERLVHSLNLIG